MFCLVNKISEAISTLVVDMVGLVNKISEANPSKGSSGLWIDLLTRFGLVNKISKAGQSQVVLDRFIDKVLFGSQDF